MFYSLEQQIFNLIYEFVGKSFLLDWLMIFFARWMPYLLVIWFLFLFVRYNNSVRKYYILSLALLSVIISRGIITPTIRYFYDRPRPFDVLGFNPLVPHEAGGSFPSGHAAFYFALVLAFFMLSRKAGFWYLSLAILMGLARIYVGVHWPSDILAGAFIAILISCIIYKILPHIKKHGDKKEN